jgi:hypothetical protein
MLSWLSYPLPPTGKLHCAFSNPLVPDDCRHVLNLGSHGSEGCGKELATVCEVDISRVRLHISLENVR